MFGGLLAVVIVAYAADRALLAAMRPLPALARFRSRGARRWLSGRSAADEQAAVAVGGLALFLSAPARARAWEAVARAGLIRPLFLPTVTAVLEQFWILLFEGEIVVPLLVSLYRAFAGLALAVVFGVLAGLLMARSKWANWALDPAGVAGLSRAQDRVRADLHPLVRHRSPVEDPARRLHLRFPDDRRDLSRGGGGQPDRDLVGGGDGHAGAQAALPDHLSRRPALHLQRRARDRAGRADHRVHCRDDRRRRRRRRRPDVRAALLSDADRLRLHPGHAGDAASSSTS